MRIRLQEKEAMKKLQREQMAKIIEDILVGKKTKKDFVDKAKISEVMTKGEILDLISKISDKEIPNNLINSSDE